MKQKKKPRGYNRDKVLREIAEALLERHALIREIMDPYWSWKFMRHNG